jgi:uncharacterized membrane protein
MYDLLVLKYNTAADAEGARKAIKSLQHQGLLILEDAAVLTADASGKVRVDNEVSRDVKIGAGAGALLGVLLMFFFPFAGLAIGAAGGAAVGALIDRHVDKKFVNEVKASLTPNSSALFLVIEQADLNALRAALAPFNGEILQTSLDPEAADQLRSHHPGMTA